MFEQDNKPDFTNEEGTKWWKDKSSTKYAQNEDGYGTKLSLVCFLVETNDGEKTRLLVNKDQEIIFSSQLLEGIGTHIDMLKVKKRQA